MWRGPRWLFAIVRADDLPQPLQRRVAIGSAPTIGCVAIASKGIVSPSGDDKGAFWGTTGGLYVNKSKIACYIMDVKNREMRVAGGGRQETM